MWEKTSQHSRICQLQRQNYSRLYSSSLRVILSPFVSFFSLFVCCNLSIISDLWSNTFPPFQHTFHDLNFGFLVFFFAEIIAWSYKWSFYSKKTFFFQPRLHQISKVKFYSMENNVLQIIALKLHRHLRLLLEREWNGKQLK